MVSKTKRKRAGRLLADRELHLGEVTLPEEANECEDSSEVGGEGETLEGTPHELEGGDDTVVGDVAVVGNGVETGARTTVVTGTGGNPSMLALAEVLTETNDAAGRGTTAEDTAEDTAGRVGLAAEDVVDAILDLAEHVAEEATLLRLEASGGVTGPNVLNVAGEVEDVVAGLEAESVVNLLLSPVGVVAEGDLEHRDGGVEVDAGLLSLLGSLGVGVEDLETELGHRENTTVHVLDTVVDSVLENSAGGLTVGALGQLHHFIHEGEGDRSGCHGGGAEKDRRDLHC